MSRIANESVVTTVGALGAEIGNLQRFLVGLGFGDADGAPLVVDEHFGPKTRYALLAMQRATALPATGDLDRTTRRAIGSLGFVPFVPAKNATVHWPKVRPAPRLIVIHTMECQESSLTAAEDVALWFAGKSAYPAPKASAHYCIDQDSVVQCVRDTDEAWHASQANLMGVGIEHAGFARQSAEDWEDAASQGILWQSARIAARLCKAYQIAPRRLSAVDIVAGMRGFCGHVDVNEAYSNRGGHTDPGPSFPWASYLALVQEMI